MTTKESVSVYICDHCKKRYFKKSVCEKHEDVCYSNPKNFRACSGCDYLHQIEKTVYYDTGYGEASRKFKAFECSKFNKVLYPYKVERMGLTDKYPESFEGQEPMPKHCDKHSDLTNDWI